VITEFAIQILNQVACILNYFFYVTIIVYFSFSLVLFESKIEISTTQHRPYM
jgi:hypothetical protein